MADPAKPEDIPIGSVIDGYVVEAKLGAGGMGAIYKVRETGTEELKALKVIATNAKNNDPEDGADNAKLAEERFQREAQVLAKLTRLEHPNIIAIHRYARYGGTQYIVMPLFSGVDLRRWVKTNPSLDRVLGVARQLAAAVGYAHSQGVLHRDLKLSNALINADDKVKLIDFGLAREASIEAHQLTQAGTASGTWAYLAPEYVASEMDHDVLTEMWATGVMLYHLVTHRLPFSVGGGDPVKLWKVIAEGKFVAVRELRPDCSVEFATLVHDLLQKDRARRVQNAGAFAQRLTAIQSAQAPGVAPAAPLAVPVPEPTRPARQPAPRPVVPPEATSSEWAPKADVGVAASAASASQGRAQLALVNQLFDVAGQGASQPVSDDDSLHMPEVTNAVLPPESAVGPRQRSSSSAPRSPPLEPSAVGVSIVGAASPAPAAQVDEEAATPSESRSRIARPTFATSSTKTDDNSRSALKKLALPGVAAVAVAGIMFGGWQYAESAVAASKVGNGTFVDPETLKQERSAKAELDDLQRAKRDAPSTIVLPQPSTPTPAAPVDTPAPPTVPQPAPRKREPGAVVAAAPAPAPSGPASAWDAIYGGRDSFNNPTAGASSKAPATTATTSAATAGVRVPVRLDGAIASSPPGPVIAVVTQETKVGTVTLPVGTQVHGQTSGTSGPRILVSFNFAIVGGQNVPLHGIAMSPDNRAGIPGTRSIGGASDVVAGGAQGAVSGLVDAAATVAGDNPAGDALRGAASPTSGKAARLNNEEELVTTKRGARFVVYVGG